MFGRNVTRFMFALWVLADCAGIWNWKCGGIGSEEAVLPAIIVVAVLFFIVSLPKFGR